LDRPLEVAVANNDPAFPGPYGSFNLALYREALALVTRPLALPNGRVGVMSDVASHNDTAIRYDDRVQLWRRNPRGCRGARR
jgi:hypothetical protein